MENKNVIIYFGKKSVINRVFAALLYATIVYMIFKLFILNESFIKINKYLELRNDFLSIFIVLFLAVRFSLNVSFHFNLAEMKYRTFYFIGPFGYGFWKKFKKLDRVSTFLNPRDECEVNIWDIKNNKYKIAAFDEVDNAVIYGRDLAMQLNIKFKERN